MKLTDYIIIFVIATLPFVLITTIKRDVMASTINRKIEINRYVEAAVEDGTKVLISQNTGSEIVLDKERALKTFYNTLYVNFGIIDNSVLKAKVRGYVPIILISESDGFTIISKDEYIDENGDSIINDVIHMKNYYSYSDEDYTYLFTNNEVVTVIDRNTNTIYKGVREEVSAIINTSILNDEGLFETIRNNTINQTIQSQVNYYIDKHNSLKKRIGISYEFYLSDDEISWNDVANGVRFIAIFQGMPLNSLGQYYSEISAGGITLDRRKKYYIDENSMNNFYYYHREDCSELTDLSQPVDSCIEAAKSGAFPCDICKP